MRVSSTVLGARGGEIPSRDSLVSIFPNAESCLRLVSALLAEVDEDWMTGKIYINLAA